MHFQDNWYLWYFSWVLLAWGINCQTQTGSQLESCFRGLHQMQSQDWRDKQLQKPHPRKDGHPRLSWWTWRGCSRRIKMQYLSIFAFGVPYPQNLDANYHRRFCCCRSRWLPCHCWAQECGHSRVTRCRYLHSVHDDDSGSCGGVCICCCCLHAVWIQLDCKGSRGIPHRSAWRAPRARGKA